MAEGKMFKSGGKVLKRVPKWAWYVSGGILIAGGVYYFRSAQGADEPVAGPTDDPYTDQGAVGYSDEPGGPGVIVPNVIGDTAVPAEINTDIPTTTLDLWGGLFDVFGGIIGDQSDALQALARGGSPVQGSNPGGVVTAAPPTQPKPKPKPNPASRLEPGYHAGTRVNMGPKAAKTFPGAIGWVRIGDGGKGAQHFIDVHVRFCNRLERWRVLPNAKGSPWRKTWAGKRPNICV